MKAAAHRVYPPNPPGSPGKDGTKGASIVAKRIKTFLVGAAAGAGAAYFLDPDRGRGRRTKAIDMMGARVRRGAERVDRRARYAEGVLAGMEHRVRHPGIEQPEVDDRTLKARVESTLFGPDFPKGDVVIDVLDGVVTLRGQLKRPDEIRNAESVVAAIPGVAGVQNLLHAPGQTAPNKADAEQASRDAARDQERIQRTTG
ncbi:MAG: BON domain-containing protein [Actinomycetota bacterium]